MPIYSFKIVTLATANNNPPSIELLSCNYFAQTSEIAESLAESILREWTKIAPHITEPYNRTPIIQTGE